MKFTKATPADAATILTLYRSVLGVEGCAWSEDYPNEENIQDDLARDSLFCLKEDDGTIIGTISIDKDENVEKLTCWSEEIKPAAELARLCVRVDYQNRGIARQLLQCGMEELKKCGMKGVFFLVSKTNEPAICSYAKLNFNVVGECYMYDHNWLCYEKSLYV